MKSHPRINRHFYPSRVGQPGMECQSVAGTVMLTYQRRHPGGALLVHRSPSLLLEEKLASLV